MKKVRPKAFSLILMLVFAIVLVFPGQARALDDVEINTTNFPDDAFRAYVQKDFDLNGDGVLNEEERNAVTYIDVMYYDDGFDDYDGDDDASNEQVGSLKGIEFFPNLEILECSGNYLHTLDLSSNPKLRSLNCASCGTEELILTKNTELESLTCSFNWLTSLDLGQCKKLTRLICVDNDLESLDVSSNTKLEMLRMNYNDQIDVIDIHTCPNLVKAIQKGEHKTEQVPEYDEYDVYSYDDPSGSTYTLACDQGTVVLDEALAITDQPADQTVELGKKVSFKVGAKGTGLSYLWQWRQGSGTWNDTDLYFDGYNTKELTVTAALDMNGYQYRCLVTDASDASLTSQPAVLTVTKISMGPAKITPIADRTYTGQAQKPAVTVTLNGKPLTAGTDYTIAYKNNIKAGTATVTVTGKGDYTGTVSANFTILPKSIQGFTISGIKTMTYTGEKLEQKNLSVKDGTTALVKDTDYQTVYKSNVKAGKAKITIKGIGNYTGKQVRYFTIKPAKTKITSAKNSAKGKVTLKWKAAKSGKGYEIQYGTKKTFKGAKTVTITKRTTKAKKIAKLKKGKTYYFRIRVYTTVDKAKVYSKWSTKVKVKIKK